MKFEPQTDEQIAASGLLANGIYDFEIPAAEDKVSSNNNEMIEIKLNIYDTDGSIRSIRDWIMPQMVKKFKHFHNACGMMDKYESGTLVAADIIGKTGKCIVKQETYTNKDGLEIMSNKIVDYVKRENLDTKTGHKDVDSDDIPF